MLIVPDKIKIALVDKNGQPFRHENILLGIRTFATHKNDIYISPLCSDTNGVINLTKADIKKLADEFISYGLMDYVSMTQAEPKIEYYFIGSSSLKDRIEQIDHMLKNSRYLRQHEMWGDKLGELDKKMALIDIRNSELKDLYTKSFNITSSMSQDKILKTDMWDKQTPEKNVSLRLPFV